MSSITFAQCSGGPCPSDGTGWKIMFASTPSASGTATITVQTGSTGLIGYTSFTLQVDATAGALNPPSMASIPNYALQQQLDPNSGTYYATYTAQFASASVAPD